MLYEGGSYILPCIITTTEHEGASVSWFDALTQEQVLQLESKYEINLNELKILNFDVERSYYCIATFNDIASDHSNVVKLQCKCKFFIYLYFLLYCVHVNKVVKVVLCERLC